MNGRTPNKTRPWVQGFWYEPDEVDAQFRGLEDTGCDSWLVWNPAGRYDTTFEALARRAGTTFPEPDLYPDIEELSKRPPKAIRRGGQTLHFTHYDLGFSVLSLEESGRGDKRVCATPGAMLGTLDEAVMDRILSKRGAKASRRSARQTKIACLAKILSKDLAVDTRRMRPEPIYIDWGGDCRFRRSPPEERLSLMVETFALEEAQAFDAPSQRKAETNSESG
jgi:hypothetical protein